MNPLKAVGIFVVALALVLVAGFGITMMQMVDQIDNTEDAIDWLTGLGYALAAPGDIFEGLSPTTMFGSSALVISNDASALSKTVGNAAHTLLGDRVGVCDGIDDDVEIQAAIDAVNALGGGHVVLTEGIFSTTSSVALTNTDNIWLSGQGYSTIVRADAELGTNGVINCRTPATNSVISDLHIDSNGTNAHYAISIQGDNGAPPGTENVTVQRCWIEDAEDDGIEAVHSCNNVKIVDNYCIGTFSDTAIGGGDGASNYIISRNHIDAVANEGIEVNTHVAPGTTPSRVVISENFVHYTVGGGTAAITLGGDVAFADISVINNVIDACPDDGIDIQYFAAKPDVSRVLIIGNKIYDTGQYGIYVRFGNDVVVSNNSLYSVANNSIYVRDSDRVVVSNNTVVDSGASGLELTGTNDSTIQDNLFQNSNFWELSFQGAVNNTLVSGNVFAGGGTSIRFVNTSTVTDATISNNYLSGAWSEQAGSTLSNVKVFDNEGYISPGESRFVSGSLTAGNANAICFYWNNPNAAQEILIKKVVVEVTTAGGTPGSHLDVGIADDAAGTNRGTEFFDDLLLNSVQVNDSWVGGDGGTQTKWIFCDNPESATNDWVVGQILDANAASLVGKYYIEYMGK